MPQVLSSITLNSREANFVRDSLPGKEMAAYMNAAWLIDNGHITFCTEAYEDPVSHMIFNKGEHYKFVYTNYIPAEGPKTGEWQEHGSGKVKDDIIINGGPAATPEIQAAFPDGVIKKGSDIQEILSTLFYSVNYPDAKASRPSIETRLFMPTINFKGRELKSGETITVEVGDPATLTTYTSDKSKYNEPDMYTAKGRVYSGFTYGYSNSIDGKIIKGNPDKDDYVKNSIILNTSSGQTSYALKCVLTSSEREDVINAATGTEPYNISSSFHLLDSKSISNSVTKYRIFLEPQNNASLFNGIINPGPMYYIVSNTGSRDINKFVHETSTKIDVSYKPIMFDLTVKAAQYAFWWAYDSVQTGNIEDYVRNKRKNAIFGDCGDPKTGVKNLNIVPGHSIKHIVIAAPNNYPLVKVFNKTTMKDMTDEFKPERKIKILNASGQPGTYMDYFLYEFKPATGLTSTNELEISFK